MYYCMQKARQEGQTRHVQRIPANNLKHITRTE